MNKTLICRFLSGWFDPLYKRLAYMADYDTALNSERKTVTVTTIKQRYWGMI